jgi:tRNA modification GTPase
VPPSKLAPAGDTIYALSSGPPPAAIALVRVSGPAAGHALEALAGTLPAPRRASLRTLRDIDGDTLDHALVIWFPGSATATGEPLAEFHLHGGRAVIDAMLSALSALGLRLAEPGEFTRRALLNGRIDISAAEGLADLLTAETESQRREALRRSEGALGRMLEGWAMRLTHIAAGFEAAIDYDEEIDIDDTHRQIDALHELAVDIGHALTVPPVERLRDGVRIAIVGPPNAGKSTLFNALIGSDAAIVSPIAGTTRDAIERPLSLAGRPIVLVDTAGIRDAPDPIERIGVDRARYQASIADIIVDLEGPPRPGVLAIAAKADIKTPRSGVCAVSAMTGEGMIEFRSRIIDLVDALLPKENDVAFDRRYREKLHELVSHLHAASKESDWIIAAEHVRIGCAILDGLTGTSGLEDVLDTLFGRFCLGK